MLFREFLENINREINQIAEVRDGQDLRPKFRYHIFILVGVGIEMLGAALDADDWFQKGKSQQRFNMALENYQSLNKYSGKDLYEHLRCGMCHVYVPNTHISLNCATEGGNNLDKTSPNQTLIQMESFLKDFNDACSELLKNIDNESSSLSGFNLDKLRKHHLMVPSDNAA